MDANSNLFDRAPLAEAFWQIWRYVLDEELLSKLWDEFRGRCYERVITFPQMFLLVSQALLQYKGSGRRTFEKNIETGELESSVQAAFGKLSRMPLALSQGMLRVGTAALCRIYPPKMAHELPKSLDGFAVTILDGKSIKRVQKRLKPLRQARGGLLGGKAVVAMDWKSGLVLAMQAHPDGDASERPLVQDLLVELDKLASAEPRLFVADRNYCDLVQAARFTAREGDHFLVRYHRATKFTVNKAVPAVRSGLDSAGRKYEECWGWLGAEANEGRRYVRVITLSRPDEEEVVLVTDLLDANKYPAADLLWLYGERWGIERVFQKLTEVFGLAQLIGGTPEACLFQFSFCMICFNVVQVLTTYVAEAQSCDPERISKEKLFDDVHREMIAWDVFFTHEETIEHFEASLQPAELQLRLRMLLAHSWSETWWKSPPQKRRRPARQRDTARTHESVYRLLKAYQVSKRAQKSDSRRC